MEVIQLVIALHLVTLSAIGWLGKKIFDLDKKLDIHVETYRLEDNAD